MVQLTGQRRDSIATQPSHQPQGYPQGSGAQGTSDTFSLSRTNIIKTGMESETSIQPSVVAIPGYKTPSIQDWNTSSEVGKAAQPVSCISDVHVYAYEPSYDTMDSFSWEAFLKTGNDLAEQLAQLAAKYPDRPIIFIAHSLGGALLKKALLLAHQNLHDPRFKLVLECLSGILFLGTPHSGVSDEDTLFRHNEVLYSCAKLAVQRQKSRANSRDVHQLANLAAAFEQIANIPILSVYEDVTPRSNRLFSRKSKALVDQQIATISSAAERLLGVHLTHRELCRLPLLRGEAYSATAFLERLFQDLAANRGVTGGWQKALQTVLPTSINPLNLVPVDTTTLASVHRPVYPGKAKSAAESIRSIKMSREPSSRPRQISVTDTSRLLDNRSAHLPCFNLKQRTNSKFTGRLDTLRSIDDHLISKLGQKYDNEHGDDDGNQSDEDYDHAIRLFAICGMGGIGKTDLAIEYAYSRRANFGAIFWLEAGSASQLAASFGQIPTLLGLERAEDAMNLESNIQLAKTWLANPFADDPSANLSWLLIFDNADNLDDVASYLPYEGTGSILITSRDPYAKEDGFFERGTGVDLEPLSKGESVELLQKLISPNAGWQENLDEQTASELLAKHFDGLPLAITQTAGFIRRRHLSVREFIDLYSSDLRYADFRDVHDPRQRRRYNRTLATAFSLEDVSPSATKLLQLLACMSPDRIREDIFIRASVTPSDDSDDTTASTWRLAEYESARYDLLTSSMIKRDIQLKELWIHRVVQAEIRSRMDKAQLHKAFQDSVALLAAVWPVGDHNKQLVTRWTLCENLLPHLEHFKDLYQQHAGNWDGSGVDIRFPTLMHEAALYLHERCFSNDGKEYASLALSLCKRANITQEPLLSDIHLTIGALSNETNDARTCLEQNILCLAIRKEIAARNGKPDIRLAFAYSQMGIAYMMVKKIAQAKEYFRQSVQLLDASSAPEDEYGFPACNLGLAYWSLGELDDADRTLTELRDQRARIHGELDRVSYKTGRVLQALGNVKNSQAEKLYELGDEEGANKIWNEALQLHRDCLAQYESTLGKNSHRTADACHKLAEHHIRLKKDQEAQDYLERALSIWGDRRWLRNESARSSFLRGKHLLSMEGEANHRLGKRWVNRAMVLRKEILPDEDERMDLDTSDFDDLVCFWSV